METWNNIDTATDCPVTNRKNRQTARQWERWAHICDSHNCEWGIFDDGDGDEFQVLDCWSLGQYNENGNGWQTITSTCELWKALGY